MALHLDRNRRVLFGAFAFVLVIVAALIWWSVGQETTNDSANELDDQLSPQFLAVGRGRVDIDGGMIQIAAQRDGVIAEVFVNEGTDVKAGQLLARLDDRVPRANLNEARASLAESKAGVAVLEVRLKAARREHKRFAVLARGGAEARKTFDEAQSRVEETLADVTRQRRATALAEARLQTAEVELMLREIHAPVDGRIVRRQARPGIGASTLNVSTLFTLVPAEQYVVRVDLEESLVDRVKTGQRVQVALDASPQAQIESKVLRIGEISGQRRIDPTDTQSRMDERVVEVVVSLPPWPYRIGQRALVRFLPLDVGK